MLHAANDGNDHGNDCIVWNHAHIHGVIGGDALRGSERTLLALSLPLDFMALRRRALDYKYGDADASKAQ